MKEIKTEEVLNALATLQVFFATSMCEKYKIPIAMDNKLRGDFLNKLLNIEIQISETKNEI